MKTFKQADLAQFIGKGQSTISKYLTGSLKISLEDAVKVEPHLPIKIFLDADLQRLYFGKSYLQDKNNITADNKAIINE